MALIQLIEENSVVEKTRRPLCQPRQNAKVSDLSFRVYPSMLHYIKNDDMPCQSGAIPPVDTDLTLQKHVVGCTYSKQVKEILQNYTTSR